MIQKEVRSIIEKMGEDPNRDGLKETPKRVEKAYKELLSGYDEDPKKILKPFDAEGYDDMVLVRDITYFSLCEHHMLPFFGKAHVAYFPNKVITGLSKIPRLVECFTKRLQNQERITTQIADAMEAQLGARGVAVMLTGQHTCMSMRGVKNNADTLTTQFRGNFADDDDLQERFMMAVKA
jgi:GTP cyclohydrolase I